MLILLLKLKEFLFLIGRKLNILGIMRTIFYDKWYVRALKVENYLSANGWIYLGSGKDRRVWKRGNVVLKIAYVENGILANKYEHQLYRSSLGKENKYAPCRLVSENILMMRAVRELNCFSFIEDELLIPDWAYKLNDGQQVGIDHNGKIMVYDYAEEAEDFNRNQFYNL